MRLLIVTSAVDRADPLLGFFHEWIREFAEHVERVMVICLREGAHTLPSNVVVYSLGREAGKSRLANIFRFYHLIATLRDEYDGVFVHMNPEYVILGALPWRLWGKQVGFWYAHGSVTPRLRLAEKLAHVVFTSSPKSFRIKSDKKRVVGHGIDTEYFVPPPDRKEHDAFSIVTVGRISPIKHVETIIDAAGILKQQEYNFRLSVIGGPGTFAQEGYYESLVQQVTEKNLDSHISFLGPLPHAETRNHLQKADLFVSASKTGSVDKVLLEAMACGVPVITSNEAFQEVLPEDMQPPLLFDGGADALAKQTEAMMSRLHADRVAIGRTLREIVTAHHSLPSLINSMVAILYA